MPALRCLLGPELRGLCHGDDFLLVPVRRELKEFEAHVSANFERGRTGHIVYGEGCVNPDLGECELEADPRHVKELPQMFNMEKYKPKTKDGRPGGGDDHGCTVV